MPAYNPVSGSIADDDRPMQDLMDDPRRRPEGPDPLSARDLAAFAALLLAVLGVMAALALAI